MKKTKKQDTKRNNWKARVKELESENEDLREHVDDLKREIELNKEVIFKLGRDVGDLTVKYWTTVYSEWGVIPK